MEIQKNEERTGHKVLREVTRQHGMTLIEIMIVVIIMSMIASGVAIAVMKNLEDARKRHAKTNVATLRSAVYMFRMQNPKDCPDVQTLKDEGIIEKNTDSEDPWENGFIINCAGNDIDIYSFGPDMLEGTDDDIR